MGSAWLQLPPHKHTDKHKPERVTQKWPVVSLWLVEASSSQLKLARTSPPKDYRQVIGQLY